ncbi:MAG: outer membrane protein transport protein [Spirochaetia bacterium]|jgi:long-chain fatty acid transport protein|nr:outer membrane protein transport protein [Spirochaetia bacterium]
MTKMEYEYDKVKGATFLLNELDIEKGDKFDQNLPAMLGVGVGYQVLPELYASTSFNYYFNDQADMVYDDSWEIALGGEYAVNEKIAVSAGGMYSKQGTKKDVNSTENPLLDSFTFGLGTALNLVKNLTIDLGFMKPIYFDADLETDSGDVAITKKLTMFAIGATYKIF